MTPFEWAVQPAPDELYPARTALRTWLGESGVDGGEATADVLLVTSELVTNGVFHDGGDVITLRAERQGPDVEIEVTTVDHPDGGHPSYRDVESTRGRGLAIVRALSHDYTVVMHDHRRVSTCRVTTNPANLPSVP